MIDQEDLFDRKAKWIMWGLLAVGLGLRLYYYLLNRSLWIDEAYVANHAAGDTWAQLIQPLDAERTAPVGFLMALKASVSLFGVNEYAIRIVPFISGFAVLPLTFLVVKRFFGITGGLIALALVAVSPPAVEYCVEVKPYILDALIALMLICAAQRYIDLREEKQSLKSVLMGLVLVGVLGVWFSHTAVLVAGGVGSALILYELFNHRSTSHAVTIAGVCAAWAVSFLPGYFIFVRNLNDQAQLIDNWDFAFLPFPPTSVWQLKPYFDHFFSTMGYFFGDWAAGLTGAMFLIASAVAVKTRRWMILVWGAPILLLEAVSLAGKYPAWQRMMLFVMPIIAGLVAGGITTIFRSVRQAPRLTLAVLLSVMLIQPVYEMGLKFLLPPHREHLRPLLYQVAQEWQDGDALFVYPGATQAFNFYYLHHSPKALSSLKPNYLEHSRDDLEGYRRQLQAIPKSRRAWFVFSHVWPPESGKEMKFMVGVLDRMGKQLMLLEQRGAWVYLYDLSAPTLDRPH